MASDLPSWDLPRHNRRSLIYPGLPPAQNSVPTGHVSGHQPRYYGRGELANVCANWLMGVFGSPEIPRPSQRDPSFRPKPLKDFIAHILRRLFADPAVTFCALYYLNRLKETHPELTSRTGHALFFSAFLIAGKVLPDTAYSNKDMARLTEGMFPLRVANQLERELLGQLDWDIRPPDVQTAREFEEQVREHYSDGPRPWMGPFRRNTNTASTAPPARNVPQNAPNHNPYPVQPLARRATHTHTSSQPQPTYQPATARPQLRVDAGAVVPATSNAVHTSRPAHRDRYHDAAHRAPPPPHARYDSQSSSATPSPITPEDYQGPRTRATGPGPLPSKLILGHGYVLVGGDPTKVGTPEGEPRTIRAKHYYAVRPPL